MPTHVALALFIASNRVELLRRCLEKVHQDSDAAWAGLNAGIPAFIDQLVEELSETGSMAREIRMDAIPVSDNKGICGNLQATGALLHRSLIGLRALV